MRKSTRDEEIDKAWEQHLAKRQYHRAGWLEALFEKHEGLCTYCQQELQLDDRQSPLRPTIDHVIPLGRGGSDTLDNCTLACSLCNTAKGNLPASDRAAIRAVRARMAINLRWVDLPRT